MIDLWADLADRFPIVSIEDGLAENDWADLADAHRPPRRPAPARRRRPLRHERRLPPPRDRGEGRQRDPRQGQPDRLAHRDARRDRARAAQRLRDRHLAPLRRDRGRDDRGHRRRDEQRPDQDGRARRAPTAPPSTTSCSASRTSSATRPSTRAGARSRASPVDGLTMHVRAHEDRRHDRAGLLVARGDRGADRCRHGRRSAQHVARQPRRPPHPGRSACARPRRRPAGRSR